MSRAVVFIIYFAAALFFVYCLQNPYQCEMNYYKKKIGMDNYCYKIHKITRGQTINDVNMKTIATSDEGVCRNSASYQTITSVSIRNKEEFDFVKMLYRTYERYKWVIHADRNDLPLLIGLTYINNDFRWYDNAPFDYTGFMENGYKSNFSQLKTSDCRRFFLYSPPTKYFRIFYSFDMDCYAQFQTYYVICRYKLPRSPTSENGVTQQKQDDEEYMNYDAEISTKPTAPKSFRKTAAKSFQHYTTWKAVVMLPVTIILLRFWKCLI